MRGRFCTIVMFALLVATPASLRAQALAPAAAVAPPAQTLPCGVAAEESWSNQEKFVWRRACAGEVANFEEEPGYGGHIDPQKAPLPQKRILRGAFIETILTQDKYVNAIKQRGLRVTGARFAERIDLGNAELKTALWLERCSLEAGVDLSWVKTAQPIAFNKSKVAGELTFYAAQIGSDLHAQDSTIETIVLSGANVARTLDLGNSQVSGEINMNGLNVGTNLQIEKTTVGGPLQMEGVQVGVYLDLRYATLHRVELTNVRTQQLSLEGAKLLGDLDMFDAQVGADLWMATAEFSDVLRLRYMQVGGQLDWSGTRFYQDVDLTGARIGGALRLDATEWLNGAGLSARFAKIAIIPRLAASWPDLIEIDGLTYDGLDRPDDDHAAWFARIKRYSRQPYEQLATVLQAQGEIAQATEVRYAEREADRTRPQQPRHIFFWLTLLKYMIGYGYYPYYALAWVAAFVLLGALVLRISGEGARNHMPWGFSYSFDVLLPVIRLRESHYNIDIAGRARYYFYFHRIMGWVLASFLVAGLSGLTK
jgi:uncharacterized protein YjbI with pentapeptide repeats